MGNKKKVVVVGASGLGRLVIAEALMKGGVTPVFMDSETKDKILIDCEAHAERVKKLIVHCPICPCDPPTLKAITPHVDNSFRGGSIGKGGKVKWERR